jgi:hypothetical protein
MQHDLEKEAKDKKNMILLVWRKMKVQLWKDKRPV